MGGGAASPAIRTAALLGAAALLLTSCTGSTEDASPTTPTTTTITTSTTAASATTSTVQSTTSSSTSTSTPTPTTVRPTTSITPDVGAGAFNDHTLAELRSVAEFRAMAAVGAGGQELVKFSITDFRGTPEISFMDMNFYDLHDEWYWFRLLNGQRVDQAGVAPVAGLEFGTIDEVYEWQRARGTENLPLDLAVNRDGRMFSSRFYTLNHRPVETRRFGLGNVIWLPAVDTATVQRDEQWVLSLEYVDDAPPDQVARFMDTVTSALPRSIADQLMWAVRSPVQEEVAQLMEAERLPWWDRIVRYDDLAVPGETEVYSAAISVGRVRIVSDDAQLNNTTDEDILIVRSAPDWLPDAAALIASTPQTPLAHVSVLARNRGIANAYVGGILDDPDVRQMAGPRAPAIVVAEADGSVDIIPITDDQYRQWRDSRATPSVTIEAADTTGLDVVVELDPLATGFLSEAEMVYWRRRVGGKAAGMLALLAARGVETPSSPHAISVVAYDKHLDTARGQLDAMLANTDFQDSERARFLLLEGTDDYQSRFRTPDDVDFLAEFSAAHGPDTAIGEILEAGGFKRLFRDQPIDGETLDELNSALTSAFAHLAPTQGLRFRSSSTVEDLDGFNGAGLYDSNTGFLDPSVDDRERSIEWAIKKTWASYWSAEAVEERELAGIDHLAGSMAVLVHPRFDDEHELANAVITFDITRQGQVMTVNVQPGDVSVANPDPEVSTTPEIVVVADGGGDITIDVVQRSDLSPAYAVLSDEELIDLYEQVSRVAEAWIARGNLARDRGRATSTVTLDLELKLMAAPWPARADGEIGADRRLILKQVRPLDPATPVLPPAVSSFDIPDDLLRRLRTVRGVVCESDSIAIDHIVVTTDESIHPMVGYGDRPFVAEVNITLDPNAPVPTADHELEWFQYDIVAEADASIALAHHELDLRVDVTEGRIEFVDGQRDLTIAAPARCGIAEIYTSPDAFLDDIIEAYLVRNG